MLEINNTTKGKINNAKTKKIVETWMKKNRREGWLVSIAIVGSLRMRRLNNDYRGIDKTTDVLSFSASNNSLNDKYLGEIVINIDEAYKANKYLDVFEAKKSPEYIFNFLLIHGLLHLIGYNDEKDVDRQKMIYLGREFLKKFYK
jgi:probable rRNA maturation factor